jgi:hypothetical protein
MSNDKQRTPGPRGGLFFPVLAVLLTVVTVVGLFTASSPSVRLARAWKKTGEALEERNEGTLGVLNLIGEGKITLTGADVAVNYQAQLPSGAALSVKKGETDLFVGAKGDRLSLRSSTLSGINLGANRQGADLLFADSTFATQDENGRLLSFFLTFLQEELWESERAENALLAVWKSADPKLETEKISLVCKEESVSVSRQRYHFDSACLVRGLEELVLECQDEKTAASFLGKAKLLGALTEGGLSDEKYNAYVEFLSGKGEGFEALKRFLQDERNQITLDFHLRGGKVIDVKVSFVLGEKVGEGEIFFGKEIREDEESTFRFYLRDGDTSLLDLTASLHTSENSKNAYVRELEYSVTEGGGQPGQNPEPFSGKIRYSWGKIKSDLGLRFITPSGQLSFGGVLKEKKGSQTVVEIRRVELNGQPLISENLTLGLYGDAEELILPESAGELFSASESVPVTAAILLPKNSFFPRGTKLQ